MNLIFIQIISYVNFIALLIFFIKIQSNLTICYNT